VAPVKSWQRKRIVVTNTVLVVLGLGGIGWQVYRNLAGGHPLAWMPLILNAVIVVAALGLLAYALSIRPDEGPPRPRR
jgi:hypothetical protein